MGGGAAAGGIGLAARAAARAAGADGGQVLDIAIVGAGLAGLTAARDLALAGCASFVVLEARDRVGGRTYNHELGGGVISEGGGEWIGPGQTAIADLARELGIQTFDSFYRGKTVYLAGDQRIARDVGDGGVSGDARIVDQLNTMARKVPSAAPWTAPDATALDRLSLGDWLAKQALSDDDKFAFDASATLTFGARPPELGLLHYLSVINSSDCSLERLEAMKDGAQEKRFVGGSQLLSLRMAQALGDKVRLSSPVRRIVGWDRDVVELHTDRGGVRARQVVAALSPALCHRIAFDPPLPAGRAEMQRLWPAAATMRKTVHVYPRPFWRDAGLNGQVMQIDGPLIWCCDNSPPDGAVGVINGFVRPDAVPEDTKAAERLISAIYAKALGEAALRPTLFRDINWGKIDAWSLSCTSPAPPGFLTKWGRFLTPPVGRLIWSGTETADIWSGAMDGAVRSGHRAALQALRALSQA
jgi:monoamine oxidase